MEIRISSNIETREKEVWLSDLPNDESLFDVINELRGEYKENKFIITEEINFSGKINKDVNFNFCTFEKAISFINCVFNADVSFGGSTFKDTFHFTHNEVIGSTNFWKAIFHKMVVFSETKFKGNENNFSDVTFIDDVFAEKIKVAEKIDFSNSKFEQNVYFPQIKAEDFNFCNVIVSESSNTYDRNIDHIFKKGIDFNHSEFTKADFSDTKFKKNIRFHSCKFYKNVSFYNTTFEKLADFYLCKFYDAQQFHLTDFFDRAIFSNVIFYEEIQFIYCRTYIDSSISFESAIFKRILDISRANLGKNINFWNIEIDDEGEQYVFENYENSKYKDDFGEHSKVPSVYKQIRESYRIIKNSCIERNDRIGATEFHKKEMDVYKRELDNNFNNKNNNEIKPYCENSYKKSLQYISFFFAFASILYLSIYIFNNSKKTPYFIFLLFFINHLIYSIWASNITIKNFIKGLKKNYLPVTTLLISLIVMSVLLCIETYYLRDIKWTYLPLFALLLSLFFLFIHYNKDKLILQLNKLSNDFGTDWSRGILFTLIVTLMTFSLIIASLKIDLELQWSNEGLNNLIKNVFVVHNVTEWKNLYFFDKEIQGWSFLILFIGRIFIGYGYYQTIQAFRKYGKSS